MLELIYPEHLQRLFTNREKELKLLEFSKEELMEGRQIRLSFLGLRRIGKSMILKEFLKRNLYNKDVRIVYLNFEEFATNPEDFALNYIARTCFWVLGKKQLEDFLMPERLLVNVPDNVREQIIDIISVLRGTEVNRTQLLNLTFSFPSILAEKLNVKIIMLLDEFQEVLELRRFRDCKSILNIMRAKIEAEYVNYVIAGSSISAIHGMVANPKSPFFNQFKEEPIEFFDIAATKEFVQKSIECNTDQIYLIQNLVYGHPFYVNAVTSKIRILNKLFDFNINGMLIKKAFIVETLSKRGDIYKHCEYIYDTSLKRARYGASLRGILKILAKDDGLNQSQIARKLRVTQGATRSYLNALIDVDLLYEKNRCYFFKDKVLRYWLSYRELGIELDEFPKEKILENIIKELEEKYLRVCTELGKTKESEIREKLMEKFGIKFSSYLKDNIEFDGVCVENNCVVSLR